MNDATPPPWELTFSEAIRDPLYLAAAATFGAIILFLFLLGKLKRELIPAFKDEEGAVRITPNALHELVRTSCEDLPDVYAPTTKIINERGKLRLLVRLRVDADCRIKETRAALRQRVEEVLVTNLGLKNFAGVDVIVKGFRTK